MNALTKKIETQVQFWSLLGPSLLLLSITVLIFKVSPHWYFPISALVGIPLCVKWKMKGLTAALGCLLLFSAFSFGNLELNDRYWHVGLSLAMAFSFIIFTLSVEEAQGLIHKVQVESQSRLDNLLLLDEKWKAAELQWAQEKERTFSKIEALEQDIAKVEEEKQTFYKIATLANEEAGQVRTQMGFLLQDLLYKKQHIAQLNERLEECELTIQDFVNSNAEKTINDLRKEIEEAHLEKETLKAKVEHFRLGELSLSTEKGRLESEVVKCQENLRDEQKAHSLSKDSLGRLQALFAQEKEQSALHLKALEQRLAVEQEVNQQQKDLLKKLEDKLVQEKEQSALCLKALEQKLTVEQEVNQQQKGLLKELEDKLVQEKEQSALCLKALEQRFAVEQEANQQQKSLLKELEDKLVQEKEQSALHLKTLEQRLAVEQEANQQQKGLLKEIENKLVQEKEQSALHLKALEQRLAVEQEANQQQKALVLALETEKENLKELLNKQAIEEPRKLETQKPENQIARELAASVHLHHQPVFSLYTQLKAQFEEKCEVLSATRKELFAMQEALLKMQKERDEELLYVESEEEKEWLKNFCSLNHQFEEMKQMYEREIDELNDFIEQLLQRPSP